MSAPLAVLAFSGGLDTSWCVHWLGQQGYRVVAVTVDVGGFSDDEQRQIAEHAYRLGAEEHVFLDKRDAYFDQVLKFLLIGNVLRGQAYPLCVGAERSLQAHEVAQLAVERNADAICHGCTGAGNDQVRFEIAIRAAVPDIRILAPIRDLCITRAEEVRQLEEIGIEVDAATQAYSVNRGLWGATIGGRETHSSDACIPESAWIHPRTPGDAAAPASSRHTIRFCNGVPTGVDAFRGTPVEVIERVDKLASHFQIGRGFHLGETILGIKGRVAFEAPAATTLIAAHRELEKLCLTNTQLSVKEPLALQYGQLVHQGLYFEPTCRDIEAFLLSSQARVTGEVHLELHARSVFVIGANSPFSLHDVTRARYGEEANEWTAAEAAGFSRIVAQPLILHKRAGQASCSAS